MVMVMVMVMVILNILWIRWPWGEWMELVNQWVVCWQGFYISLYVFCVFISGVVIFCIRIKYRLFAGQGEGKSFTDARQVKILFHHNMNKSKNMIIMSCCHVDSTLLIHNKMPSHHRRVLSYFLKRISRFKRKVSSGSESGDSFVRKSCFQSLFGNLSQSVLIF